LKDVLNALLEASEPSLCIVEQQVFGFFVPFVLLQRIDGDLAASNGRFQLVGDSE